jgi:hypothetical protein
MVSNSILSIHKVAFLKFSNRGVMNYEKII